MPWHNFLHSKFHHAMALLSHFCFYQITLFFISVPCLQIIEFERNRCSPKTSKPDRCKTNFKKTLLIFCVRLYIHPPGNEIVDLEKGLKNRFRLMMFSLVNLQHHKKISEAIFINIARILLWITEQRIWQCNSELREICHQQFCFLMIN